MALDYNVGGDEEFDYDNPRYKKDGIKDTYVPEDEAKQLDENTPEEPRDYDHYDQKDYDDISDDDLKYLKDNDMALDRDVIGDEVFDYDNSKYNRDGIKDIHWDKEHPENELPHREQAQVGTVYSRLANKSALRDRDGRDTGTFLGDVGTNYNDAQLPYNQEGMRQTYYKVVKPFDVDQSTIAKQGQWGPEQTNPNAQQYNTKASGMNIQKLVDEGYLKEISPEEAARLTGKGGA